jgi:putative transcriptional regulator
MIKLKVAELMKKKGLNATDVMRKANIAYATALRISKGEGDAISFEVLNSLCQLFDVQVQDILEYIPDK